MCGQQTRKSFILWKIEFVRRMRDEVIMLLIADRLSSYVCVHSTDVHPLVSQCAEDGFPDKRNAKRVEALGRAA